ncbi:MAG: ketosteroid isomerase family protein [Chroococcales cyanobacterium]
MVATKDMTNAITVTQLTIEGIQEPIVLRYFETLNSGNFEETSTLFAKDGALHAPFESPIVGQEAIASYLKSEAQAMTLHPQEGIIEELNDHNRQIKVTGYTETPWFSVNVAWQFILTPDQEIFYTRVKLLASPQELLKMRNDSDSTH